MPLKTQLLSEIVPQLVADGKFGKGMVLSKADATPMGGLNQDHWMSETFSLVVEVCAEDDKERARPRTFSLVAKFVTVRNDFREFNHLDRMARNEVQMYSRILPFFRDLWEEYGDGSDGPMSLIPKCYLSVTLSEDVSLIVMENLKPQGFRLTTERSALDKKHVFMALRSLGKFHALSYAAKRKRGADFLALTELLQEGYYTERNHYAHQTLLKRATSRGMDRLAERKGDRAVPAHKMERARKRLEDPFSIMTACREAVEPMAVLVHGDFVRNNMFFKYNDGSEDPVDVRFFDFQTCRYSSPATDLSLFIFLNTSADMRAKQWDDLLVEYYEGLSSTLQVMLFTGPNPPSFEIIPSLGEVRSELERHALYGFAICCFFLPFMLQEPGQEEPEPVEGVDAHVDHVISVGGDEATEKLADFVLEFIERGLL